MEILRYVLAIIRWVSNLFSQGGRTDFEIDSIPEGIDVETFLKLKGMQRKDIQEKRTFLYRRFTILAILTSMLIFTAMMFYYLLRIKGMDVFP